MKSFVSCLVEGAFDEAVMRKVFKTVGIEAIAFYYASKPAFFSRLRSDNKSTNFASRFAICDLDKDACAPSVVQKHLPEIFPRMCFRIAVRTMETWLMADREAFAAFLAVPPSRIPQSSDLEKIQDPKEALVNLARRSRNRAIASGLVPKEGATGKVGREYNVRLKEFVHDKWSPRRARKNSESLCRAFRDCERFAQTGHWRKPT